MKKYFIICTYCILQTGSVIFAQKPDAGVNSGTTDAKTTGVIFRTKLPEADKTEIFEIVGIKGSTFSVSNTADGTANSYKHSKQVTIELTASNNSSYFLVFYSPEENIPYTFSPGKGVNNLYYPLALYDAMRQKLEQSLAAKKKIQLQMIQKTDGFREVSLIF